MKEIEQYRDLFINREDAYATQGMDGSYICQKKEVTDKVLVDHLKGRITCGWYCLSKDNQIKWACVDAGSQDGQKLLQRVSQRLKGLEIPSYIEESREGRGHLWMFLEPLAAKPVRKVLERGFHRRDGFDPEAALLITKVANSRRLPWGESPVRCK